MPQTKFEELLEENEEDLKIIRSKYFPLIEKRIITGYNLYPSLFDYSQGELFLNYFHSDLRPEDKHFQELSEILQGKGFLEKIVIVNSELVNGKEISERLADYITEPDWQDPFNMRYFDYEGNEISTSVAKGLGEETIGESLQYDMLIRVKNEQELRRLVDLFKKYVSKHKLSKSARIILENLDPVENKYAISKAHKVPLLVCTSKKNKKPKNLDDFLSVKQFIIPETLGDNSVILSTLVRKNAKELKSALNKGKIIPQIGKKYVLRLFVEEYIDPKE